MIEFVTRAATAAADARLTGSGVDRQTVVQSQAAAVGVDGLAGDERRIVAGEEGHDRRDLRGFAEALHRRALQHWDNPGARR